ncbi:hypothetical protein TSAR_014572 [Trichomalopsis sarcophagae]|uniref:Uncharacterized protein n=1 Tax=Trichomalopsis sarcophagae TaxID=543379 RepID=A0A232EKB2_9HYME|nr:hypothetical protein TSAR_014572 [Trichomalopsis sarcophagae]
MKNANKAKLNPPTKLSRVKVKIKREERNGKVKQDPSLSGTQTHNPTTQGDYWTILNDTIRETIKYAERRINVHWSIKTVLAKALEELGKIEKKSTFHLLAPKLHLGRESLEPRKSSQESLATIVNARSIDNCRSNSSTKKIAEFDFSTFSLEKKPC